MRRSVTSQDEEEKLKDLLGISAKAGRYLSLQEIPIDRTKSADLWVVEKLRNYKLIGGSEDLELVVPGIRPRKGANSELNSE